MYSSLFYNSPILQHFTERAIKKERSRLHLLFSVAMPMPTVSVSSTMPGAKQMCGDPLPVEEVERRRLSQEWAKRVGYKGTPAPGNPCGPYYRRFVPFTVNPDVANNREDFAEFIRILGEHKHSFRGEEDDSWKPIRPAYPGDQRRILLHNNPMRLIAMQKHDSIIGSDKSCHEDDTIKDRAGMNSLNENKSAKMSVIVIKNHIKTKGHS